MQDQEPDNPDASSIFQKWFGGLVLPALLLCYGIWVLLPPHQFRMATNNGQILLWYLLLLTWSIIAICTAVSCFCYYLFDGMIDRIWVKRVFTASTIILLMSGATLMILLLINGILGYARRWR
jgi:hypothetical protein